MRLCEALNRKTWLEKWKKVCFCSFFTSLSSAYWVSLFWRRWTSRHGRISQRKLSSSIKKLRKNLRNIHCLLLNYLVPMVYWTCSSLRQTIPSELAHQHNQLSYWTRKKILKNLQMWIYICMKLKSQHGFGKLAWRVRRMRDLCIWASKVGKGVEVCSGIFLRCEWAFVQCSSAHSVIPRSVLSTAGVGLHGPRGSLPTRNTPWFTGQTTALAVLKSTFLKTAPVGWEIPFSDKQTIWPCCRQVEDVIKERSYKI